MSGGQPLTTVTAAAASTGTFIKAIECWLPSSDRSLLEFGGGLYGTDSRMARISRDMCFGRGEGLPGRAWQDRSPVVMHGLDDSSVFKRTDAARADGLTCGIALPIFGGDYLGSVVVFFCGDDDAHAGAIEVWRNDPAQSKDLTLTDGHYGRTGDTFEFISRRTSFRPGIGLPGLAWQQHAPVFLPDLGRGSGFLRADTAVKVGINRGFALPCATPGREQYVLAFLSALGTPLARRVEIWKPADGGNSLVLQSGFCEVAGLLGVGGGATVECGQGSVGRCWMTGLPTITTSLDGEPGAVAAMSGLRAMAVVPVLDGGRFVAAVAMYW